MADFKISENYEEEAKKEQKKRSLIPIILIVIISLASGLLVFFISNNLFGNNKPDKEKENPSEKTEVALNDPTIKELYERVTHESGKEKINKFIKEQSVTTSSFSNYEKYYYALQFAKKTDFVDTNNQDAEGRKIYILPEDKIKHYMQAFFGKRITYSQDGIINYQFDFEMPEGSYGTLKYSKDAKGYNTIFTNDIDINTNIISDHYSILETALKKDNNLTLKANIIYTKVITHDNLYDIEIYKDYERTMLLDIKQNQTLESITENPIDIEDYETKAATITYTFEEESNNYYFISSKITN